MTTETGHLAAAVEPRRGSRSRARDLLRLTGQLGHVLTQAIADRLDDRRLVSNETVLLVSALAARGPLRPRDLLPVTGVTSGGMTRQLDRLERLGLIERSFGAVPGDRRASRVALTDAGRRAAESMGAAIDDETDRLRDFVHEATDLLGAETTNAAPLEPSVVRRPPGLAAASTDGSMRLLLLLGAFGTEVRQAVLQAGADDDLVRNLPMAVLCELDERGPARPADLMRASGLSSGGMTKLLDRLEERGLAARQHGTVDRDRRATVVSITPDGVGLVDRFAESLSDRRAILLGLVHEVRSDLEVGP